MALYGTFASVRAQAPQTPGFATAFAYGEDLLRPDSAAAARLRAVAVGKAQKIDLGGGVFVMEQAYETKARADGFFESHRSYIDVQIMLAGQEVMELADLSRIKVKQPYLPERDLITYEDFGDASLLRAFPGDTAIFYPVDVHMPAVRLGADAVVVRKAVVKVPVTG